MCVKTFSQCTACSSYVLDGVLFLTLYTVVWIIYIYKLYFSCKLPVPWSFPLGGSDSRLHRIVSTPYIARVTEWLLYCHQHSPSRAGISQWVGWREYRFNNPRFRFHLPAATLHFSCPHSIRVNIPWPVTNHSPPPSVEVSCLEHFSPPYALRMQRLIKHRGKVTCFI